MPLLGEGLGHHDVVPIKTNHDAIDYTALAAEARLVVDTHNA